MKKFPKDRWILDMLAKGYLIPQEDGSVYRARRATKDGVIDKASGYSLVVQRVHKKTGRVYFNCTWRGYTKSILVNRVVALRYHPNPHNYPQVNHKDGDKENNAKRNLEWASGSQNEKHAHRTGLKSGRGSGNSNARLSVTDVHAIRASDDPVKDLAERYGVSRSTITNVIQRKSWTHV